MNCVQILTNGQYEMIFSKIAYAGSLLIAMPLVQAGLARPYPEKPLTADQIALEVYFSLHGMHQKNAVMKKTKGKIAVVLNRVLDKKVSVNTLEAFINNEFSDGITESKQLAIYKSGKMKGTGILMTSYIDGSRQPSIALWLPSVRKVRRMVAPSHADKWMGTNMTYGDVYLRRPEHEIHELLGITTFGNCLGSIKLSEREKTKRTESLPAGSCSPKGKEVYQLKSTTRFKGWWYDYRLTDIDTLTFSPYRSVFYKDGKQVKIIEADWKSLNKSDPRMVVPNYIYAKTIDSGQESMLIIPFETIEFNTDLPESFWSEKTLRKIKR